MKGFLRKLLSINTLKIILINPLLADDKTISQLFHDLPVRVLITDVARDMKVIDTGIVVRRKPTQQSEQESSGSYEVVNDEASGNHTHTA